MDFKDFIKKARPYEGDDAFHSATEVRLMALRQYLIDEELVDLTKLLEIESKMYKKTLQEILQLHHHKKMGRYPAP